MNLARALIAALLVLAGGAAPAAAASVEFLHVEANVGAAGGGHLGVRFGERVFHYRNVGDGQLRLAREDFDFFRYVYSVLENRTIHVARVEVDAATWERLRDRFDRRHLVEETHFETLRALRSDVALLERLLGDTTGPREPRVPGAAFFQADGEEPALLALRRRVGRDHGERFLAARRAFVDREISRLRAPLASEPNPLPSSRDRLPAPRYAFSERSADLAAQRLALEALDAARPLRARWRRSGAGPGLPLTHSERETLAGFAERLEANLSALVASARPDWGYPLLLGMARLVVIQESLRGGRLVVLDALPDDARTLALAAAPERRGFHAELRDHARGELERTRARVRSAPALDERAYNDLEDAANRLIELEAGGPGKGDVRVSGQRLVPRAAGPAPERLLPPLDPSETRAALPGARERVRASERALEGLYGYELLARNCVTEIFATIDAALGPEKVERLLGGRVEPRGSLAVIPFVAFDAVAREYRVVEIAEIPSYRRQRLAEMYAREHPLRVYLREANTLTSSIYRKNPRDSFFLLFTDDVVLPRPLFGVLNFAAGLGQTALGLVTLPFDRGRGVVAGARGAFFSLPELAFFNVRKGSLEYGRSRTARTAARRVARRD